MNAVEAGSGALGPEVARKPVAVVLLGYLATVLMPSIGFLFGVVALTRPGRWAKRQGVGILVLAAILITFGIALLPMITESYFADKANSGPHVSSATQRAEEESQRQVKEMESRVRREGEAIDARIRESKAQGGR